MNEKISQGGLRSGLTYHRIKNLEYFMDAFPDQKAGVILGLNSNTESFKQDVKKITGREITLKQDTKNKNLYLISWVNPTA